MAAKSKQELAANRLAGRLTSLRATLRKDEREMLDQMVSGATFELEGGPEVGGHSMVAGAAAGAAASTFKIALSGATYAVTFK